MKKIIFLVLLMLFLVSTSGCKSSKQVQGFAIPIVGQGQRDKIICPCGCNDLATKCTCPEAKKALENI